jgi:hypothetical protein
MTGGRLGKPDLAGGLYEAIALGDHLQKTKGANRRF